MLERVTTMWESRCIDGAPADALRSSTFSLIQSWGHPSTQFAERVASHSPSICPRLGKSLRIALDFRNFEIRRADACWKRDDISIYPFPRISICINEGTDEGTLYLHLWKYITCLSIKSSVEFFLIPRNIKKNYLKNKAKIMWLFCKLHFIFKIDLKRYMDLEER